MSTLDTPDIIGEEIPEAPETHSYEVIWTVQKDVAEQLYQQESSEWPSKKSIKKYLLAEFWSEENLLKIPRRRIQYHVHPKWGKVGKLAELSGWENEKKYIVSTPRGFRAWITWMFDREEVENEKKIWKEEIGSWLLKQYGSAKNLLTLGAGEIRKIEYPKFGKIVKLGTFSGWKNPDGKWLQIPEVFQKWIKWLYDIKE